jgi:hypothetical protein
MGTGESAIDTLICVHENDINDLFSIVLRSYALNFQPKGRLLIVSNNLPKLRDFVGRIGWSVQPALSGDEEWLSVGEQELPGWYRQQLIKLRAYRGCETQNLCCLSADTVLLRPVTRDHLLDRGAPVLYYYHPRSPLALLEQVRQRRYERERVQNVARMLRVAPMQAARYVDFILDLFCFSRENQIALDRYLDELYGTDHYVRLLSSYGTSLRERNLFGEWTLYSVFVLDYLKQEPTLRNAADGYLAQIHSRQQLRRYRFDSTLAHFVGKDFDLDYIRRGIARRSPALADAG